MKKYYHERVRNPKTLHHYRTITRGKHRIIVGCPSAHLKGGQCPLGMKTQSILHPKSEHPHLYAMQKPHHRKHHSMHNHSRHKKMRKHSGSILKYI